jgi:hypothetical protein
VKKNRANLCNPPALPEPNDRALAIILPNWADLPRPYQQELIQALADLLLRQPQLQALLEAHHEPES